jgi:hypothetical protein
MAQYVSMHPAEDDNAAEREERAMRFRGIRVNGKSTTPPPQNSRRWGANCSVLTAGDR